MGKVTIKDVAKEAGVSISLVSFVMNNVRNEQDGEKKKEQIDEIFPDKRKSGLHFLHYLTDRKDCRHAASKADAAGRLCCPPL